MVRVLGFGLLSVLVLAASASASGFGPGNQPPPECEGDNALGSNACLSALEGGIDVEVEKAFAAALAYQDRMATANAQRARAALEEAQAAWQAYRDASCEAFGMGGGITPKIRYLQCRRWTAWQRLKTLNAMMGIEIPEEDESGGGLYPYFSTLADTHYSQRAFELGDFSWNVKKDYGSRIVERILLDRGFEAKTARHLAEMWDAWRFHPETGQPMYEGSAMSLSETGLIRLAHRIPDCIRDAAFTSCRLLYSIELGCRLDPEIALGCQRALQAEAMVARSFPGTPEQESVFMNYRGLYGATACLLEGGKGAGAVVFAPGTEEAVAKLTFLASRGGGDDLSGREDWALPQTPREAPQCSSIMPINDSLYAKSYEAWLQDSDYVLDSNSQAERNPPPDIRRYEDRLRQVIQRCGPSSC